MAGLTQQCFRTLLNLIYLGVVHWVFIWFTRVGPWVLHIAPFYWTLLVYFPYFTYHLWLIHCTIKRLFKDCIHGLDCILGAVSVERSTIQIGLILLRHLWQEKEIERLTRELRNWRDSSRAALEAKNVLEDRLKKSETELSSLKHKQLDNEELEEEHRKLQAKVRSHTISRSRAWCQV